MKLTINGAFKDCIESILHHNNETIPHYMFTTEITMDNDNSKEELVEMFKTCISFEIQAYCGDYDNDTEGSIQFIVKRPQEDLNKFQENRKYSLECSLKRLKNWSDKKIENKEQIFTYLKAKKLDWIIEEIS